jgi:hypothetical protein
MCSDHETDSLIDNWGVDSVEGHSCPLAELTQQQASICRANETFNLGLQDLGYATGPRKKRQISD